MDDSGLFTVENEAEYTDGDGEEVNNENEENDEQIVEASFTSVLAIVFCASAFDCYSLFWSFLTTVVNLPCVFGAFGHIALR